MISREDDLWLAEDGDTIIISNDIDNCKAGERCVIIDIDREFDENDGDASYLYLKVKSSSGTAWIDIDNEGESITLFKERKCP